MRIFRLVGAVVAVAALCALTGSGAPGSSRPLSLLSAAPSLAAESGSAQALPASANESDRTGEHAGDPSNVGDNAEGVAAAGGATSAEAGLEGARAAGVAPVLALLFLIITAARLGGDLLRRLGLPRLAGEFVIGIILGNLALAGFNGFETLFGSAIVGGLTPAALFPVLAEIGALLLLFGIGLRVDVRELTAGGPSALLVALIGVVAPLLLGWGIGVLLLGDAPFAVHLLIGAILCAASTGITARVLTDLNRLNLPESRIVLSASALANIAGLVLLAVAAALLPRTGGAGGIGLTAGLAAIEAVAFVLVACGVARWGAPFLERIGGRLERHIVVTGGLLILFLACCLADAIGLNPLVAALAAGIALHAVRYENAEEEEERTLEELIRPVAGIFLPLLFVWLGYSVDLAALGTPLFWALFGALTVAALGGRLLGGLGVMERGLDRLSIGIGMAPKGETGLVFAALGCGLLLEGAAPFGPELFAAIALMAVVTTIVVPPVLGRTLIRPRGYEGASDAEMARIAAERREKRKEYYRSRDRRDGDRGRGRGGRGGDRNRGRGGGRSGDRNRGRDGQGADTPGDERRARSDRSRGDGDGRRRGGRGRGGDRNRGRDGQGADKPRQQSSQQSPAVPSANKGGQTPDDGAARRRRRPRRRRGGRGRGGSGSGSASGGGSSPQGGGSYSDST